MRLKLAVVAALGICLPLMAAVPKQDIEAVTTDRVSFVLSGAIRVSGGVGQLNVEGWDQPAVEITVTRMLFRQDTPKKREQVKQRLDGIRVVTKRNGDRELIISTEFPSRKLLTPFRGKTEVDLDYRIKVPRDSRLTIRHDAGDILIYGVGGDMDASTRVGNILLQLPDPGPYSIDARSGLGDVNSEFSGKYHDHLLGQSFTETASPSHSVRLRVGVGGITIQRSTPLPQSRKSE
jgi:hypothetical protein